MPRIKLMKEFEISLADLRFHAFHGVMPLETKVGNEFIVSVCVRYPFSPAILDDDIASTINYAELFEIVKEEMEKPKKLLETVAAAIASRIMQKWACVTGGHVTICKSTPPIPGITGAASVKLDF